MKYLLDLQFFADEDEEIKDDKLNEDDTDDNSAEEDNDSEDDVFAPVITFDEILSDKMYQSEFDKKVAKALATNAEKFEKEIQELKEYKEKYEKVDSEYNDFKKSSTETQQKITREKAIEVALAKSGTRDEVALKAHLGEFIEDAEFDDKGNVVGMTDKINQLKGSHSYLFGSTAKATGFELGKGDNKVSDKQTAVERAMGVKSNT